MNTLTVHGLRVRYADVGRGTPVVLAHCSSASHREWAALTDTLGGRYRVLAPDLIGYGASDPWPTDRPYVPSADADAIAALATRVGGRLHLVGHSYGAAMALDAAHQLGDRVLSLSLVEPVSFHLLRLAGRDREWDEVTALARVIGAAVQAGKPRKAAAAYMGFWIGRARWLLMRRAARARIVATVAKVAHEFGAMDRFDVTLDDYARLDVPVRLVVGERTQGPARAVADVLTGVLPHVETVVLPGAGHMSPFTHCDAVVRLLAAHVDRQQDARLHPLVVRF